MTSPVLQVEPTGEAQFGPCECCGNETRRVWGFVHRGEPTEAAYFVEWTSGAVERHGAKWDLIIGTWGSDSETDRVAIALDFRRSPHGPEFMVVDAIDRKIGNSALVGRALGREEVLGGSLAPRAFAIVDAIWLGDARIVELTRGAA